MTGPVTSSDARTEPGSAPTRCRACGGVGEAIPVQLREMMFGTRERFRYTLCAACGSLSIDEVPDDLGRHYPPTYYSNHARVDVTQDPAWRRSLIRARVDRRAFGRRSLLLPIARRLVTIPDGYRLVRSIVEQGQLRSFDDPVLDVGCGAMPTRLAILRKLGFRQLLGVEPYLQEDTTYQGVHVRKAVLEDIEGHFAVIMFHHSLEHVSDPVRTLRSAVERLQPGGRCLVRTPIMGTHLWRTYGPDWVELDAPRHLVIFTLSGLERTAAQAGLEVESVTWESGAWEFIASEQFQRDIATYEPGSWFVHPSSDAFDEATIETYRAASRRVMESGDAGRAAIWLRRAAGGSQRAD